MDGTVNLATLSDEQYKEKESEFEAGHQALLREDEEKRRHGIVTPPRFEKTVLSEDRKSFIKVDFTKEEKALISLNKKQANSKMKWSHGRWMKKKNQEG